MKLHWGKCSENDTAVTLIDYFERSQERELKLDARLESLNEVLKNLISRIAQLEKKDSSSKNVELVPKYLRKNPEAAKPGPKPKGCVK